MWDAAEWRRERDLEVVARGLYGLACLVSGEVTLEGMRQLVGLKPEGGPTE